MPANRPPDRASYGSHLPSGIEYLKYLAENTSSERNRIRLEREHKERVYPPQPFPKGPDAGPAASPAKKPKKPKDPNLNPGMTVPFGRR